MARAPGPVAPLFPALVNFRSGRLLLATLALCVAHNSARGQAQAEAEKPADLKRQIDELQSQLRKLELSEARNHRVAEIGTRYQQREAGMVVRLYDLNDLFAVAPSYDARRFDDFQLGAAPLFPSTASASAAGPAGMGTGGMGGMFSVPSEGQRVGEPRTPQYVATIGDPSKAASVQNNVSGSGGESRTSIHTLVEAITTTIAPASWQQAGGEGSIARIGNSLLISAEIKTHEQIENLLSLFRQRWKTLRTVTLRAYWLWLSDDQLAALVPESADEKTPYGMVDDKAWRNRPAADAKLGAGYRAMLTCYNGQTVAVTAGGERLSVAGMDAEKAERVSEKDELKSIYHPRLVALQDGAALQFRPVVSTSGKYVAIDLHSRVARLNPAPPAARPEGKRPDSLEDVVASIDRPQLVVQELSTTLRAPINRTLLVGGMTFEGAGPQTDVNLYLFVRATVQDLTDDTQNAPAEGGK